MSDQTEAFPLSPAEKRLVKLKELRNFLLDEMDKRDKAVASAVEKREDAVDRLKDIEEIILSLEVSTPVDPVTGELEAS